VNIEFLIQSLSDNDVSAMFHAHIYTHTYKHATRFKKKFLIFCDAGVWPNEKYICI